MDPATITALIAAATQLSTTIGGMIRDAKGDLSSEDEAALKAAAAQLRAANDQAYDALQTKLQAASQR